MSTATSESRVRPRRRSMTRHMVHKFWAPLVLVLVAFTACFAVTASHSKSFSPIDEWVYYDYLLKVPTQGVVRQGDLVGAEANEAMSCNLVLVFGNQGPACGSDYTDPTKYPQQDRNSADTYTPAYFWITWVIAKLVQLVSHSEFLTAARFAGAFWLAAGLLVFYRLLREFSAPKLLAVALGTGFAISNFSVWTYTFISTDQPAFLFGAAALLAGVLFLKKKCSGWWLIGVSALAILFKTTNFLAVGLAILVLCAWVLFRRHRHKGSEPAQEEGPPTKRVLMVALGSLVAGLTVQVGWLMLRSAIAIDKAPDAAPAARAFPGEELIRQFGLFLPKTILHNVNELSDPKYGYFIPLEFYLPLSWLCIIGAVAVVFSRRRSDIELSIGSATLIAALTFGPILTLALAYGMGVDIKIPERYGAALLPAYLLGVGIVLRNRVGIWLIVAYAAFMFCLVVGTARL